MQELYNADKYPPAIRNRILRKGRFAIAIAIANRWMLDRPDRVKKFIRDNEYLPLLMYQEEQEVNALAENCNNSITDTEKVQLAGLSLKCP